jgi:maspardin
VFKCYPQAKLGHLKSGGNFPFLSRSDEFNLFLTARPLQYWFHKYLMQMTTSQYYTCCIYNTAL